MSTNLLRRLADYRDDIDAAIETHRAATLVEPIETPRPPRHRLVLAVAVIALIAGGIGLVVVVNRGGPSHESASRVEDTTAATVPDSIIETVPVPSTTTDTATAWTWLDQFGTEVPQPPVPDGWKVLDFEAFRFAVPADWTVPGPFSCSLPEPGFVLIAATEPTLCAPSDPPPPSVLSILPAADAGTSGTPTTIGTLSAVEIPPQCTGCAPTYLFDIPYQLSVSGPEAEQILGTFTDSGFRRCCSPVRRRIRQPGRRSSTRALHSVSHRDWPVIDLPASFNEVTLPNRRSSHKLTTRSRHVRRRRCSRLPSACCVVGYVSNGPELCAQRHPSTSPRVTDCGFGRRRTHDLNLTARRSPTGLSTVSTSSWFKCIGRWTALQPVLSTSSSETARQHRSGFRLGSEPIPRSLDRSCDRSAMPDGEVR